MRFDAVQRILGVLLMVFSLTMVPPLLVGVIAGDGTGAAFIIALVSILIVGALLWLPVRNRRRELRARDGFLIVSLFWISLGLAGAIPFAVSDLAGVSVVDAVFESVSGLTTTGATVITGIEDLPVAVRYYRQQLQWLGGMGIIVLAVAILPMLGIGGMQLYRAELPGPVKDSKLTPRLTQTAKALWYIYLTLTVVCAGAYWLAGMTPFDAVAHAFSTVATGGFSTHDASIGYFDSAVIEMITVVFMLLSAFNFSLHFYVWRRRSIEPWRSDPELRFYVAAILVACAATMLVLTLQSASHAIPGGEIWRHAIFQVVSFATTTGYTTEQHALWPAFVPVLLLFLSFMGGSANSTSGGIKVVRVLLLFRQGWREIVRLIHPQAQLPVKLGDRAVDERVIQAVWGFFGAYVGIFSLMMLTLMAMGLDQVTAFSATASGLNNLGPGLGEVASHFADVGVGPKLLLCFAMILGRLELFTLLVLFTPTFWRR